MLLRVMIGMQCVYSNGMVVWSTAEVNIFLELFVALLECPGVISHPAVVYLSPECRNSKIKKR